jgi:hypothetical protein
MSAARTAVPGVRPPEPGFYIVPIDLTANQALPEQPVQIDKDTDFELTGIQGVATSHLMTLNIRLPSGSQLANVPILWDNLVGTAADPTLIGPHLIYKGGGRGPAVELTDLSGAGNTGQLVFAGIRHFKT